MIDSHCHLDHEPLFSNIGDVINRAKKVGLKKLLTISTNLKSFENIKKIIEIDSNQINTIADFTYLIDLERVGETIDVLVLRNGLRKTYIVEVEPFPTFIDESPSGDTPPANIKYLQGATFMKKDNGIFVVSVEKGSNAYNIGLRKEDLIKQVNQKKVNNLNDLYDAMNSRNRGVMMQLIRGNVSVLIIRN